MVRTKWSSLEIPKCIGGKRHKWKGSDETGVCLKCGYDVFDRCYHPVAGLPNCDAKDKCFAYNTYKKQACDNCTRRR